jgi:flotillin
VRSQLEADVVRPWEAELQKMQQEARAAAAPTAERGRAEAAALKMLLTEFKAAGDRAKELLVLQQLIPMIDSIAGADRKTLIREWVVVPTGASGGDGWVNKAIGAMEQVRAATGVDLAQVLSRPGAPATPTTPPGPAPQHKPPAAPKESK